MKHKMKTRSIIVRCGSGQLLLAFLAQEGTQGIQQSVCLLSSLLAALENFQQFTQPSQSLCAKEGLRKLCCFWFAFAQRLFFRFWFA